jgi:murein L,D-transpeptidase YafK
VLIGKNSGDKLQEGDKVTPIGAYKLSSKLTRLDQFYGPLALVTDYPNKLDRILGKTGHGIWLHGMPLDEKRENNYTKGCIAFDNTQLVELDKKIDIKKTILLIYENDLFKVTNENIVTILSQLYKWKHAWEKNDMAEYMTFYDKDFIKYNGQKLRKFKQYKQSIFSRKQYKEITFKNINIIPYPNIIGQKVFKVFIHEEYYSRSYKFKGDKELYLEVIDGKISILAES